MNDSTKQTKEKIKIMQAFLDGKEVQLMKYDRPEWALVRCPEWDWVNFNYRLKPEKKIIDLSKMVGSDILCEFSNSGNQWSINKLTEIDEDQGYYYYDSYDYFYKCRIMQDHFHSWQGGECPLPEGLIVEIRYIDHLDGEYTEIEEKIVKNYQMIDWSMVIAFKVLGAADGYCYEWESEK